MGSVLECNSVGCILNPGEPRVENKKVPTIILGALTDGLIEDAHHRDTHGDKVIRCKL